MAEPLIPSLYDQFGHEGDDASTKREALLHQMKGKASVAGPSLAAAAGDVGDIISTQYALSKGAHEANPLVPNDRFANAATLAGEAALFQYLMHKFGPDHPTLAKVLGYGRAGVGAYSTLRNIQSGQQSGR